LVSSGACLLNACPASVHSCKERRRPLTGLRRSIGAAPDSKINNNTQLFSLSEQKS